ncbi:MAG TPA: DUF1588 domain-containing protein [Polyangiaceae bacterium]|nr:DUF1588 domain-containing protein [Polyangiaceae bacterium]
MRALPRKVVLPALGLVWGLAACHGSISSTSGEAGGSTASGATGGTGGAAARGGSGGSAATSGSSGKGGAGARGGSGGASGAAGQSGAGPAPTALETGARRLTRSELDNIVRDLFGDATSPAQKVLAEDEFNPFDNDYTLQRASRALIDSLEALADDVAARALAPAARSKVVPCTPSGAGDTACFRETVTALGLRLFRRPLADDEVSAYMTLQAFSTEDNPDVPHDFYTGIELVLRSMLQDPEFLYRLELGTPQAEAGVFKLGEYELATRLSFLLWGSTPSDALLESAAGNGLSAASARRTVAEGMLDDDRARDAVHRFHAMWLGYRSIPASAELASAFDLETTHLIDRVVFDEPKSYLELFTSPETYVNNLLADQYGLTRPSGGEGWVSYGTTGREGILSHGSVLAAFSKFSDTSPTQRGIFVQTRLLCNKVDPPPANVNVDQPPTSTTSACKYDRYAAHRTTSSCAGCHNNLDPIGFGLEQYDIGGRLRTHDDGHPECTIDGEGELPGYGTFSGPGELSEKLVGSGELSSCFVEQWLSYALGRHVADNEAGVVDELSQGFSSKSYAAKELLLDYVASDRFALRREEPAP